MSSTLSIAGEVAVGGGVKAGVAVGGTAVDVAVGLGSAVSVAVGDDVGVAEGGTGVSVSVGVGGRGVQVWVGVGVGGTGVDVGDASITTVKVGDGLLVGLGFLVGSGVRAPRSGVRVGMVCWARS